MATDQQVQHYQEQARRAQAMAMARYTASHLSQAPDVSAFAGMWEAERRQALAALSHMAAAAHARCDYVIADALTTAKVDVFYALRQRATWAIEEGMRMPFAHEVCA